MTDQLVFMVFGTPTPKGRPRFFNNRAVTDAKTRAAEQSLLAAYRNHVGDRPPHDGPIDVEMVFTFAPAVSWPKWKLERATASTWEHVQRPDIDNLIKLIDGLNGHAWLDDSQITNITARKQYGSIASTRITLTLHPQQSRDQQ